MTAVCLQEGNCLLAWNIWWDVGRLISAAGSSRDSKRIRRSGRSRLCQYQNFRPNSGGRCRLFSRGGSS